MKRTSLLITIAVVGLCLIAESATLAERTVRRAIPVTSSLAGNGALPDPTVFNYRVQSDLFGPYVKGVDSVGSELQTGGDWRLDALASPNRTMLLDFRDAVAGSNPTPPFLVGNYPAMIETKSYLLYGNGKIAGMTGLNSTLITPLVMRFDINGNTYRVLMNSADYPQTNYGLVTCAGVVSPTDPQCNHWTIEPSVTQPDGQKKNIAKLVRFYTSKGKTIQENHGDYYLSFAIDITNP